LPYDCFGMGRKAGRKVREIEREESERQTERKKKRDILIIPGYFCDLFFED